MASIVSRFGIVLILCVISIACGPSRKHGKVMHSLARGVRFQPPGPADLGDSLLATQKWIVHGGTRTYRFTAYLEVSPEKIVLVGMTPAGTRGFLLTRDTDGIHYEHLPFFRLPIEPEIMLAHALLGLWPEASVRRGLDPEVELQTGDKKRALIREGREIVTIAYEQDTPWRGTARIHNLVKGHLIEIRTIRVEHFR